MNMELNKIYLESCIDTICRMKNSGIKANIILTSPPYNTSVKQKSDPYHWRYGNYEDFLTNDEYVDKTTNLFLEFDNILAKNGVILYNLSYGARNPSLFIRVINDIIVKTPFELFDTIIWKKSTCLPDNSSPNRLSRITEFVFVFARKEEKNTFQCNKEIMYQSQKKGKHKIYSSILNIIEAKNNDGSTKVNKATYSTDLCDKLLKIYAKEGDIVYDPFMGTGTTAISAIRNGCKYIGSEIDDAQVDFSEKRIAREVKSLAIQN